MIESIQTHPISTIVVILLLALYSWVAYEVKTAVKAMEQENDQELDTTNLDDFANQKQPNEKSIHNTDAGSFNSNRSHWLHRTTESQKFWRKSNGHT